MKLALKILLVAALVLLLSAGGVLTFGWRNLSREVPVPPHDLAEVEGDPAFTEAELETVWAYLNALPPVDRPRPAS